MSSKYEQILKEQSLHIDPSATHQILGDLSDDFVKIRTPFRIHISGPTMSGMFLMKKCK